MFAKCCLRGAIENIFDYVEHLSELEQRQVLNTGKHIESEEDGKLLKVLKFQRQLLFGGLMNQKDVNGINAQGMVIELDQQKQRNYKLENNSERGLDVNKILEVLKGSGLEELYEKKTEVRLELPEDSKKLFDEKKPFNINKYEDKLVERGLEKDKKKRSLPFTLTKDEQTAVSPSAFQQHVQNNHSFLDEEAPGQIKLIESFRPFNRAEQSCLNKETEIQTRLK